MKGFTVLFVLAVLSGCHARSAPPAAFPGDLEDSVDRVRVYFSDLGERAGAVVDDIRSSQIGRDLETLVQDSVSELGVYSEDLQTKLAPYTQKASERLGRDLQRLGDKLRDHMLEGRSQMEKYGLELQTMMEQNADDVRVRVTAYTRKLRKRLNKDTQEIQRFVSDYLDQFQSSTADNLQDLRAGFHPFLTKIQDNADAKMISLNNLLGSVGEKIMSTGENLRENLQTGAGDLKTSAEDKMEDLKTWVRELLSTLSN